MVDIKAIKTALAEHGLLTGARGEIPDEAAGITDDSRKVKRGDVFIAIRGSTSDGHDYLSVAAEKGAAAAIVEDPSRTSLPVLWVREGRRAAALAASTAFGNPARTLRLIGVTGTNGKTTTTSILRHIFDDGHGSSASIGTLGVLLGSEGDVLPGGSGLTTPGPVELQRVLRELADRGVRTLAMEVSSHSLDQRRIDGLWFDVVVFTNLTRDHLDYHGTMENYFRAKARLLDYLKEGGTAVVNADAPEWAQLKLPPQSVQFAVRARGDVRAQNIRFEPHGSEWDLVTPDGSSHVSLPLIGDVNVENALAAAASAFALGLPTSAIAERLSSVPQVAGRLEIISTRPTVLRDYAHTPDALERSLHTARAFTRGKLIVVFGAGGDRDKGKRPLMGDIAERGADCAIVTSDNPRTEDPDAIINDIEAGMRLSNHERVTDRLSAIKRALEIAEADDIVLLAGKGHETYQVRGTTSYPFDEKEIVRELIGGEKRGAGRGKRQGGKGKRSPRK
ncbi:MAG TPA: UDP-N-acetylmuramoyl-L-alanyl-D-glutamate--2,6-diaminopimelate ligase [Gemmatimonadaceae bacterium]|nr:UDP-N-acetylmuramoyl-L-alanyl-D-glutamate--2,6-diaminopimelate ligase [Gemmatimonadaceae bacterium]